MVDQEKNFEACDVKGAMGTFCRNNGTQQPSPESCNLCIQANLEKGRGRVLGRVLPNAPIINGCIYEQEVRGLIEQDLGETDDLSD